MYYKAEIETINTVSERCYIHQNTAENENEKTDATKKSKQQSTYTKKGAVKVGPEAENGTKGTQLENLIKI